MLAYRNSIQRRFHLLPSHCPYCSSLPLSSLDYCCNLLTVFQGPISPAFNPVPARVSILKYNHVTILQRILLQLPMALEKECRLLSVTYLHKVQYALAPLYLISLFPFSYLTHSPLTFFGPFSQILFLVPGITLSHLLILTYLPRLSLYITFLQKPSFSQAGFDASLCIVEHTAFFLSDPLLECLNSL